MKPFLLSVGLLLSGATVHAQVGVRASLLATEFSSARTPFLQANSVSHLGYQLGVFYELGLAHHLALVPELALTHQYALLSTGQYGYGFYATNADVRLTYLTLPVPTRVYLGPAYAEVGPQLNLLLGGSERGSEFVDYGNGVEVNSIDRSAAAHYYRLDVGLCAGLGVQLRGGLGLGLRAYWGMRSLARPFNPGQGYNGDLRNSTVQASLSYRLKRAS